MKSIQIILSITLMTLVALPAHSQLNKKISTKQVSGSKLKNLTTPIPIKRMQERDFKNKLTKDIKKSKVTEMRVPASYLKKPSKKSWKITPARAFGSGNLGFTLYSGQLRRQFFVLEMDFAGRDAVAFVGYLTFDAKKGKTYLIRVTTGGANSSSYIKAVGGGINLNIYGQSGSYPILIEAQETGEMLVAISARHKVGGNERYPDPLPVKEITIDEL